MVALAFFSSLVQQLFWPDWATMNPVVGFKMLSPALLCILEAHSGAICIRNHDFSVESARWRIQDGCEEANFLAEPKFHNPLLWRSHEDRPSFKAKLFKC